MPEPPHDQPLPPALTAAVDQRLAEAASVARMVAAHHDALKGQGLPDGLIPSLTEMYASYIYDLHLHVNGCHDHDG